MEYPPVDFIKAVGAILVPIVLGYFGYLQSKCRTDLNIAHAKLRAHETGKPWEQEMRTNYRFFGLIRRRRPKHKPGERPKGGADGPST